MDRDAVNEDEDLRDDAIEVGAPREQAGVAGLGHRVEPPDARDSDGFGTHRVEGLVGEGAPHVADVDERLETAFIVEGQGLEQHLSDGLGGVEFARSRRRAAEGALVGEPMGLNEDVVLAREVVGEHAVGDAGHASDLPDGRAFEALLADHPPGGVEYLGAARLVVDDLRHRSSFYWSRAVPARPLFRTHARFYALVTSRKSFSDTCTRNWDCKPAELEILLMTIITTPTKPIDAALRERARKVIPAGMYGHMNVTLLPAGYPQYYTAGDGVRLTDADGNEYLDLMCAFGPMVSGYGNATVDAAAAAQLAVGDALGGPTPRMVELAELMVDTVAHADWAMFCKNGTDATSLAVMIARAATGKSKLLKGTTAYHGANAWFTPIPAGVTAADRADIIEFTFNDLASLETAAVQAGGDVAAIILSPFRHDGGDQQDVELAFARGARDLADRLGAALIMDEVRTGFRLHSAGAWEPLGIRPDLTAYSKAMANGYAISSVVGIDALRSAAADVYATGSFWYGGVAMAAAIANITLLRASDTAGQMAHVGQLLRDGLAAQSAAYGLPTVQSGPPAMPFLRFVDDGPDLARAVRFSDAAVRRGVLLHPAHNWFLSTAHTAEDIATILERTDEAFAETRDAFA